MVFICSSGSHVGGHNVALVVYGNVDLLPLGFSSPPPDSFVVLREMGDRGEASGDYPILGLTFSETVRSLKGRARLGRGGIEIAGLAVGQESGLIKFGVSRQRLIHDPKRG